MFGGLRILFLPSVDDMVPLVSLTNELQFALGYFSAEGEAAEMRISTSMSEEMFLCQDRVKLRFATLRS